MARDWIPVRRHWRLNERHYGDLQGKDKKQMAEEHGADKVKVWRRSYDTPPPPLDRDDERHARFDPRYADLAPELHPGVGVPQGRRRADAALLVRRASSPTSGPVASCCWPPTATRLRALVKHLDGIADDAIAEVNLPTGIPLVLRAGRRPPPGR